MAHSDRLHENCLACHGPGAFKDIKETTHPERDRCRQCHVPQSADPPPFPGVPGG